VTEINIPDVIISRRSGVAIDITKGSAADMKVGGEVGGSAPPEMHYCECQSDRAPALRSSCKGHMHARTRPACTQMTSAILLAVWHSAYTDHSSGTQDAIAIML